MLRTLNQNVGGRTCDQGWIEIPNAGHALRNLNTTTATRRIMGVPTDGFMGSTILDSGGASNPLANDGLSRTSRYRMVVGVSTFPTVFAWENGAIQITVPGALVYQLYEDGIRVVSSQDSRTVTVTAAAVPPTPTVTDTGGRRGILSRIAREKLQQDEQDLEDVLAAFFAIERLM